MELFSEIYNCYYQIVEEILHTTTAQSRTKQELNNLIQANGYEESSLFILPKLIDGEWNLLMKTDDTYTSKIHIPDSFPPTLLQKSYIKALLSDTRISLFFTKEELCSLQDYLSDVEPLFNYTNFYYFDQFCNGDDYTSLEYQKNFRIILEAIKQKEFLKISFTSRKGNQIRHSYLPCRLEYSSRNNRFRILVLHKHNTKRYRLEQITLQTITQIERTNCFYERDIPLNTIIQDSYYKEPVKLLIYNKRNAIERAMLNFANYEKNTIKIDENTYECSIYYNKNVETELLIEILAFGPSVKVLSPPSFLRQIRERVALQSQLLKYYNYTIKQQE